MSFQGLGRDSEMATRDWHSRRSATAILACVLASFGAESVSFAVAVSGGSELQEAQLRAKLTDNDKLIKRLQSLLNGLGNSRGQPIDGRGKTLNDDLRQFVLAADARSAITTSRQNLNVALDKHDIATAQKSASELESQLRMEALQYLAITQYWSKLGSNPPDRGPYLDILRQNGIAPRHADDIQAHETKLDQQVTAGYFQEAMNNTYPALLMLYERAYREELVEINKLIVLGTFKSRGALDSHTACKPAANRTSGGPLPKSDSQTTKLPAKFYSDESRFAKEEGSVTVLITVTSEGCVSHSALVKSAGYPRLDDAALTSSLTLRFLPAEREGKAVESVALLPINFALDSGEARFGGHPTVSPK
jgi:TonB family protein